MKTENGKPRKDFKEVISSFRPWNCPCPWLGFDLGYILRPEVCIRGIGRTNLPIYSLITRRRTYKKKNAEIRTDFTDAFNTGCAPDTGVVAASDAFVRGGTTAAVVYVQVWAYTLVLEGADGTGAHSHWALLARVRININKIN
jgi:hypothetical protein